MKISKVANIADNMQDSIRSIFWEISETENNKTVAVHEFSVAQVQTPATPIKIAY